MFTPYHIHCVTCNATLKVGREEFVGEILTCPRCHSMVKVEADIPQGNSGFNDREVSSKTTSAKSTASEGSVDSQNASVATGLVPPIQAPPLPEEKQAVESPRTEHSIPRLPVPPKTAWPSWLLLTTAAIGGAMLTASIWGFLKGGFTSHPPEPAKTIKVTTPDIPKHPVQASETPDQIPIHPVHTKEGQPEENVSDPPPIHNSGIATAAPEPKTLPTDQATDSKTPTQQREQNRVDAGQQIVNPQPETSDQAKLPANEASDETVSDQTNLERTQHITLPAPNPEVAAQLDLEIERLHFKDTSLGNVLDLITQLTGIPINIDDEALLDRQLSRNSRIQFTAEKGRVSDVLASLLKQEGLAFVATGNQIIITGAKPRQ